MDSVSFHPMYRSQVSKKMSMKIPYNFKARTASSRATVRKGLWRCPDALQYLEASALKTFRRQSNTVRTLGQASPISTQSWILAVDTVWEVSARRLDNVTTRPDDVQHSRIFRVSFTSAQWRYSEDCPDARPSRLNVDLLWEELRYFGKPVAVDRPDAWSSLPDALQYFDHNFLLKYRIGMKLVSLES
jgi:hypothetical protein